MQFSKSKFITNGKYYRFEPPYIVVFGIYGAIFDNKWAISMNHGNSINPWYVVTITPPVPVNKQIIKFIRMRVDKKYNRIARIVISSRIAVRLFLEGIIKVSDFDEAEEAEMQTSKFVEDGEIYPVIHLKGIQIGEKKYPVSIFAEKFIGQNAYALLDKRGKLIID